MQPLRLSHSGFIYLCWLAALVFVLMLVACAPVQPVALSRMENPATTVETSTETSTHEPEGEPTEASAVSTSKYPVTIENCGLTTTYTEAPSRAVTMNQASTEIMLALGLQGSMVGTASLDDAILPQWQNAYASVPVLADAYPSQEILFDAETDFVYGSYRSAFAEGAAGPRTQLAELGIKSYLSIASCEEAELRPEKVTFTTLFDEILKVGRIFGVEGRAQAMVEEMQETLDGVLATIGDDTEPVTIFWYDSEAEAPYAGSCCGAPAMIMEAAGAENIFADTPGTWANVTWEEVVARQSTGGCAG